MTTDSVFILFKKTDFNTILARLGGLGVSVMRGFINFFVAEMGGHSFTDTIFFFFFFVNWDSPSEENASAQIRHQMNYWSL